MQIKYIMIKEFKLNYNEKDTYMVYFILSKKYKIGYVGMTSDIHIRIKQHVTKSSPFLKKVAYLKGKKINTSYGGSYYDFNPNKLIKSLKVFILHENLTKNNALKLEYSINYKLMKYFDDKDFSILSENGKQETIKYNLTELLNIIK